MRIFDTRFYLANLGTGAVDVVVDQTENSHLFWASAQGALDLADRGKIKMIFPTRRNLERLAQLLISQYVSGQVRNFRHQRRSIGR